MEKKLDLGNKLMKKYIHDQVMNQTGIQISGVNGTGLQQCSEGPSNGNQTVKSCPVDKIQKSEFLVLVYNPQGNGVQNTE
jgi:hypothetical protein